MQQYERLIYQVGELEIDLARLCLRQRVTAYEQFLQVWQAADADIPAVRDTRARLH